MSFEKEEMEVLEVDPNDSNVEANSEKDIPVVSASSLDLKESESVTGSAIDLEAKSETLYIPIIQQLEYVNVNLICIAFILALLFGGFISKCVFDKLR